MMLPTLLAVLSVQQQAQQTPAQVDWRTKGVTTPVMDQGQMGSAVAYSMAEYVFLPPSVYNPEEEVCLPIFVIC